MAVFCRLLRVFSFRDSMSSGQQKEIEMTDCVDVVIWPGKFDHLDEGPLVDEFERCVWAGMPDNAIVERMAWLLDMPERCLEVLRLDKLAVLKVIQ
ncbi:hypothetical protein AD950_06870 [Gluconobacter oxydans]|nr:hypothetical protein AD950_06870 [Gluconobacter oxydans]